MSCSRSTSPVKSLTRPPIGYRRAGEGLGRCDRRELEKLEEFRAGVPPYALTLDIEIQGDNAQFNERGHIFGFLGRKAMLACGNSYPPLKTVLITGISWERAIMK